MEINVESIKKAFEQNPIGFLGASGALLMGVSKIIEAVGNARGSHAYARDVNRRIRNSKKKGA